MIKQTKLQVEMMFASIELTAELAEWIIDETSLVYAILIFCSLTFGLLFYLNLHRMYKMGLAGQNLQKSVLKAKRAVEDILMTTASGMSKKENKSHELKVKMSVLKSRLDDGCPIEPLSYFKLNKQTLISIQATVLTYIIILLQFKLSEMQ